MTVDRGALRRLLAGELDRSVPREIAPLSERVRRGRSGVLAVLFYGAGLWKARARDTVLDLYVLVERYRDFDARVLHAVFGRLLPPNVYYLEHNGLHCKYAVMRLDQFRKAAAGRTWNTQIWARFAQPCRLVHARDPSVRDAVLSALTDAVVTFHAQTLPLLAPGERQSQVLWRRGLARTYGNEWRSESADRAGDIYTASREALDARTAIVLPGCRPAARVVTRGFPRMVSKSVYFLQLMKAVFTFDGGVDYALWKIERQSGVKLSASDFQRRHPLLSAWPLVWKAWRQGALR